MQPGRAQVAHAPGSAGSATGAADWPVRASIALAPAPSLPHPAGGMLYFEKQAGEFSVTASAQLQVPDAPGKASCPLLTPRFPDCKEGWGGRGDRGTGRDRTPCIWLPALALHPSREGTGAFNLASILLVPGRS